MRILLLSALLLPLTHSCSVAPYAGIDRSRYQKVGTDWDLAKNVSGISAEVIDDYLKDQNITRLAGTQIITGDFRGKGIYLADFSPHCDQKEGRPAAFHVTGDGPITVRNLYFKGTGHDGIHIHSGRGQGWDSKSTVSRITFDHCIFTACEDAVTIGFRTRDITFQNCIFVANPDGNFRDKLAQLNHAENVRFVSCYFAPTKNGVEFKSGATISARNCTFDRCSTAWRVRTSDSYGGIVPEQPTLLDSTGCTYRFSREAFYLDGTVKAVSSGERFRASRKHVLKRGAEFELR